MSIFRLVGNYFLWHYGIAFLDMFHILSNFLWFFYHFFSIPTLLHTLFSPWKKIHEERETVGFNLRDIFSVLIVNVIMRFIGFLFRVSLIIIGVISIILAFFFGVAVFIVWILTPFIIIGFFITGIIFLVR